MFSQATSFQDNKSFLEDISPENYLTLGFGVDEQGVEAFKTYLVSKQYDLYVNKTLMEKFYNIRQQHPKIPIIVKLQTQVNKEQEYVALGLDALILSQLYDSELPDGGGALKFNSNGYKWCWTVKEHEKDKLIKKVVSMGIQIAEYDTQKASFKDKDLKYLKIRGPMGRRAGVFFSAQGYGVVTYDEIQKDGSYLEGLSDDQIIPFLQSFEKLAPPLYLHNTLQGNNKLFQNLVQTLRMHYALDFFGAEGDNKKQILDQFKIQLWQDFNLQVNQDTLKPCRQVFKQLPLPQQTQQELGLLDIWEKNRNEVGVASLIDKILPETSPKVCKKFLRQYLLNLPPWLLCQDLNQNFKVMLQRGSNTCSSLAPMEQFVEVQENDTNSQIEELKKSLAQCCGYWIAYSKISDSEDHGNVNSSYRDFAITSLNISRFKQTLDSCQVDAEWVYGYSGRMIREVLFSLRDGQVEQHWGLKQDFGGALSQYNTTDFQLLLHDLHATYHGGSQVGEQASEPLNVSQTENVNNLKNLNNQDSVSKIEGVSKEQSRWPYYLNTFSAQPSMEHVLVSFYELLICTLAQISFCEPAVLLQLLNKNQKSFNSTCSVAFLQNLFQDIKVFLEQEQLRSSFPYHYVQMISAYMDLWLDFLETYEGRGENKVQMQALEPKFQEIVVQKFQSSCRVLLSFLLLKFNYVRMRQLGDALKFSQETYKEAIKMETDDFQSKNFGFSYECQSRLKIIIDKYPQIQKLGKKHQSQPKQDLLRIMLGKGIYTGLPKDDANGLNSEVRGKVWGHDFFHSPMQSQASNGNGLPRTSDDLKSHLVMLNLFRRRIYSQDTVVEQDVHGKLLKMHLDYDLDVGEVSLQSLNKFRLQYEMDSSDEGQEAYKRLDNIQFHEFASCQDISGSIGCAEDLKYYSMYQVFSRAIKEAANEWSQLILKVAEKNVQVVKDLHLKYLSLDQSNRMYEQQVDDKDRQLHDKDKQLDDKNHPTPKEVGIQQIQEVKKFQNPYEIIELLRIFNIAASTFQDHMFESISSQKGWQLPNLAEAGAIDLKNIYPYYKDQYGQRNIDMGGSINSVVKNSAFFDKTQAMYLLTGQNASGKSTLIRAVVGCLVLGSSGLFIPGDGDSQINFIDKIYYWNSSRDAPQHNYGHLAVELGRMEMLQRQLTSKSVVLLDEVGKSSNPDDILGYIGQFLETLDKIGCKGIFSTHIHGLVTLRDNIEVPHLQLKNLLSIKLNRIYDPSLQDIPSYEHTYKLQEGYALNSAGISALVPHQRDHQGLKSYDENDLQVALEAQQNQKILYDMKKQRLIQYIEGDDLTFEGQEDLFNKIQMYQSEKEKLQ